MRTLLLALLLATFAGAAQAAPEGAPVVDVTAPVDLKQDARPVLFVPAGRPVRLNLRVEGGVARSEPTLLELRFDRALWFYGPETGEPLVSRDGTTWRPFSELFSGSVAVGMGSQGLDLKLEMNDRP